MGRKASGGLLYEPVPPRGPSAVAARSVASRLSPWYRVGKDGGGRRGDPRLPKVLLPQDGAQPGEFWKPPENSVSYPPEPAEAPGTATMRSMDNVHRSRRVAGPREERRIVAWEAQPKREEIQTRKRWEAGGGFRSRGRAVQSLRIPGGSEGQPVGRPGRGEAGT